MLNNDFILKRTRCLLKEFIEPIVQKADKPRKKFIRQAVGAILLAGSLVVTEFARWIHDDCSDRFHTVKRLLNHLVSSRGDLAGVVEGYRTSVAGHIQHDTPIIIDLTDLAKPRARKMKYLAYVRDGSEHKQVPGYWCVEVYAHLKGKRVLPLALDAYSVDDPDACDSFQSNAMQPRQHIDPLYLRRKQPFLVFVKLDQANFKQ